MKHLFLIFQQLWQCLSGLLGYGMVFLKAMMGDKATLAARLLAAESQLSIYQHSIAEKKVPTQVKHLAFGAYSIGQPAKFLTSPLNRESRASAEFRSFDLPDSIEPVGVDGRHPVSPGNHGRVSQDCGANVLPGGTR